MVAVETDALPSSTSIIGEGFRVGIKLTSRGLLAVAAAVLMARSAAALAGDCIEYSDYIHRVGSVAGTSGANDVAVAGSYAYVAAGYGAGFQVLDISDPASPILVGRADVAGGGVAVAGSYAYVAGGGSGLQVVDVSDPTSPAIAGSVETPGGGIGVAVAGSYAYVVGGSSGLQVIDISDPGSPVIAGKVETPSALAVALAGSHAYVADGQAGLLVIAVSNPRLPEIVGSVTVPNDDAVDVAVAGSHAYVVFEYSFLVLDISDPERPVVVGSSEGYRDFGVAVAGSHAYVLSAYGLDGYWGLKAIDISNPAEPRTVGVVHNSGEGGYRPRGVAAAGAYVYVTNGSLDIFDVSKPTFPPTVAYLDTPGQVSAVAVAGAYAYIADGPSGLQVVNVADPSNPAIVGAVDTGGAAGVAIAGSLAHVAAAGAGLQVIDISDPAFPAIIGSVDTPGLAQEVAVAGSHAYVADGSSGLQVIDVSDPTSPAIVGSVKTSQHVVEVAVDGSRAYVMEEFDLLIIDISDPTAPVILGRMNHHGRATGDGSSVAVAGNYAYVVGGGGGMRVVDVSNPASPAIVSHVHMPGWPGGLTVAASHVYVVAFLTGLEIFSISDPRSPVSAGCAFIGDIHDVTVAGAYAYLARGFLQIIPAQCETPTAVLASELSASPRDDGILIRWRAARGDFAGFDVLRATGPDPDPEEYQRLGQAEPAGEGDLWQYADETALPGRAYAYLIEGQLAGGGTRRFGPVMAARSPELGFALQAARPFPARETVMVPFSLPRPAAVMLEVYDPGGRRVRSLLDGVRAAGGHLATWDGRDDAARRVASGVYFIRLSWPGGSSVQRAALLR